MRPFEGFQRKAIVIVPTDEEFKRRCEQREKEEGKDVPDTAVLEMKGGSPRENQTEQSMLLLLLLSPVSFCFFNCPVCVFLFCDQYAQPNFRFQLTFFV